MKFKPLYLAPVLLAAMLGLAACSKQDVASSAAAPAAAPASKRAVSLDIIAAEAKGFAAGSVMSANTAYVFFDPQCPHCAHLWQASLPLQSKFKFVWIPVAYMGPASVAQGAALMTAADPVKAMTEHEASVLARSGGISAPSNPPKEQEEAIKKNTALLTEFEIQSVPFIVVKNVRTGQMVTRNGALETPQLAEFLGVPAS